MKPPKRQGEEMSSDIGPFTNPFHAEAMDRTQRLVAELKAEIEELREEIIWCHGGLTRAHVAINPDIPVPDWDMVYKSLRAAEAAGGHDD